MTEPFSDSKIDLGEGLKRRYVLLAILFCFALLGSTQAFSQTIAPRPLESLAAQDPPSPPQPPSTPPAQDPGSSSTSSTAAAPTNNNKDAKPDSPQPKVQNEEAQQTKRILWVIPNYRSVTANTQLPPLSLKEKFWLAAQDSFDYSGFVWSGIVAGISMASKSEPSFGQGASGYGIYYAHSFADNTVENFLVEAILPVATKEDPRYYTLGHGGFFKRTAYSVSRLVITRSDSGHHTVNISEVVGAGASAGISELYYPATSNPWVRTYQHWGSQLLQDGISNVAKEFWPDINRAIFHNKY